MKKLKISIISSVFTLAIIVAVSLCAVVICTQNANADTANEENLLPQITFKITPDDEKLKSMCSFEDFPYTGSDEALKCMIRTAKDKSKNLILSGITDSVTVHTVSVDVNSLTNIGYGFSGFYIKDKLIDNETIIDSNTEIEIRFYEIRPAVQINIRYVQGTTVSALPDYNIDVYDKNHNLKESSKTDVKGMCLIDFTDDLDGGYILGWMEGKTDTWFGIDKSMFEKQPQFNFGSFVADIENSNYSLTSNNNNHAYFKQYSESSGSLFGKFSYTSYVKNLIGFNFRLYSLTLRVNEDMTIGIKNNSGTSSATDILTAVSKDGAKVNHWIADYSENGTTKDLYPGVSVSIDFASGYIFLEPVYDESPQPGPTPDPVPTPAEEVNAVAQTGDSTNALLFAIFAFATAATILTVRRKFN